MSKSLQEQRYDVNVSEIDDSIQTPSGDKLHKRLFLSKTHGDTMPIMAGGIGGPKKLILFFATSLE